MHGVRGGHRWPHHSGIHMGLVALSIAVLVAAPAVAALLVRRPLLAALLDSFVLVSVGGIVALHVIPESAHLAGPVALLLAVVGLFLPIILHRVDEKVSAGTGRAARDALVLAIFIVGLFVHALFDGAALVGADVAHIAGAEARATNGAADALALGVILHRLPVGIALWVVVRPRLGNVRTLIVACAYAGGTVVGAVIGSSLHESASADVLALVQAFVAGSILHVVFESAPLTPDGPRARQAGLVGAALAAIVLVALPDHEHDSQVLEGFRSLAFVIAPAVLVSFILVGLLSALYPDGPPRIPGRGMRVVDAVAGVAAGLPHPLCSCSVAPLYQTLVDRGASAAGARAFLVAAPELGVPAVLLSARLLGLPFTITRVIGAALLALFVGVSAKASKPDASLGAGGTEPILARLSHGMRHGLKDAVDHIAPWLLLGLFVASFLSDAVSSLSGFPPWVQAIAGALLGLPLYLCAAGTTPVAAVLLSKGASVGGVLALLLVGPAASAPTLSLLARLHGKRVALGFAMVLVVGAAAIGMGTDMFVSIDVAPVVSNVDPTTLELVAVGACLALIVSSLLRQGVRGFVLQIMSPQHEHAEDHAHGPGCGHDHGPPIQQPVARVSLAFDPRGKQ
jgi:uncharacterized protein